MATTIAMLILNVSSDSRVGVGVLWRGCDPVCVLHRDLSVNTSFNSWDQPSVIRPLVPSVPGVAVEKGLQQQARPVESSDHSVYIFSPWPSMGSCDVCCSG